MAEVTRELIRPSWHQLYLNMAWLVSTRSTCYRLQVGAVAVDRNWQVISTGYNGAPKGQEHCGEECRTGTRCIRTVHAEANIVAGAASRGISLRGASVICTHRPCLQCAGLLVNAGITDIFFSQTYKSDSPEETYAVCGAAGVHVHQIEQRGPLAYTIVRVV